ncbi:MAG: ABC transporter permease [Eubacteriales bacterium]|nr:ABC transporter permease [Eubacteriales bacterium]
MFYTSGQRTKWQKILFLILPVLSIALVILAYAMVQSKMPLLLPDAKGLWERFIKTFVTPIKGVILLGHIWASLRRVVIALIFAWTLGIGFGVMIGWNRTCKAVFGSIFELFRPIPPIAWIPIIIMWFGIGEFPKILIVFIGSFIPVVLNTEAGIRMVEKEYIDVGRVFGASHFQLLKEFVIPTALPSIFAGIKTSVSCAWTVVLAAEMLGADHGIGSLVTRGWNAGDMALVFVSIICIGIIGAMLAFILNKLEKVVCPWNN